MRGSAQIRGKQWAAGGDLKKILETYDHATALMGFYLQTSQLSHWSGIYYLPYYQIEMDLDLDHETIEKLIQNLEEIGLIKYDREHHVVWVINMARDQAGNGKELKGTDKKIRGIHTHVNSHLPDSPLCEEFTEHYRINELLAAFEKSRGWGGGSSE